MTAQTPQQPHQQPNAPGVDSGTIGRLNERQTVVALLACLPMHEDGTGHVADCGFDLDAMPTCGCASLPGRLAAIVREHVTAALAEVDSRINAEAITVGDTLRIVRDYREGVGR